MKVLPEFKFNLCKVFYRFHTCASLGLAEVIQHQSQRVRERADAKKWVVAKEKECAEEHKSVFHIWAPSLSFSSRRVSGRWTEKSASAEVDLSTSCCPHVAAEPVGCLVIPLCVCLSAWDVTSHIFFYLLRHICAEILLAHCLSVSFL